jgi:hypothetical protein
MEKGGVVGKCAGRSLSWTLSELRTLAMLPRLGGFPVDAQSTASPSIG